MSNLDALHVRAKALNLHGLLAHWGEAAAAGWLATLIDWEEQERRMALVASLRKSSAISASKAARSQRLGQVQSKSQSGLKRPI